MAKKTSLRIISLFALYSVACYGQQIIVSSVVNGQPAQNNLTTSTTGCTDLTSCVTLNLSPNQNLVGVQITGTWSATVVIEGSTDCTTFSNTYASTTINMMFNLNSLGLCSVRARVSSFSSGTIVATLRPFNNTSPATNSVAIQTNALNNNSTITERGARWQINNNASAASGVQGTVSKSAGAAGVRHVIDCIGFSADSAAAITAANTFLNVRDGATGAGTIIWQYAISFPTAAALGLQEVASTHFCGLNLIGTSATALTIEFAAAVTGAIQSVNATGYDVQ